MLDILSRMISYKSLSDPLSRAVRDISAVPHSDLVHIAERVLHRTLRHAIGKSSRYADMDHCGWLFSADLSWIFFRTYVLPSKSLSVGPGFGRGRPLHEAKLEFSASVASTKTLGEFIDAVRSCAQEARAFVLKQCDDPQMWPTDQDKAIAQEVERLSHVAAILKQSGLSAEDVSWLKEKPSRAATILETL